jgi:hypothetical protein
VTVRRDRAVFGLHALDEQVTTMLSLLGFSPTSRPQLGVAEIRRASALEEFLRERDDPSS